MVQLQITITEDKLQFNILKGADATVEQYKLAKSIEKLHCAIMDNSELKFKKEMDSPLTEKERRVLEKEINNVWACDCGYKHYGVYEGFKCRCGRVFNKKDYEDES